MFVLEGNIGDVIAMTADGIEARIAVLESNDGKVRLAIEAPIDAQVCNTGAKMKMMEQDHKDNFRQELLFF